MSRRSYKKLEQQPLPPFAENLVFWAPLTEGDLTDHISGVEGVIPQGNTNCTVSWDSSNQMYRINNRVSYFAGLLFEGLNMFPSAVDDVTLMRNVEKTIYHEVQVVTTPNGNGYASSFGIGGGDGGYNNNVTTGIRRVVAEYLVPTKSPLFCAIGTKHIICLTRKNNHLAYYVDKNIVSDLEDDQFAQIYYNRFGYRVSLCFCAPNAGNISDMLIKDVRIYNRALTAEEVAQL